MQAAGRCRQRVRGPGARGPGERGRGGGGGARATDGCSPFARGRCVRGRGEHDSGAPDGVQVQYPDAPRGEGAAGGQAGRAGCGGGGALAAALSRACGADRTPTAVGVRRPAAIHALARARGGGGRGGRASELQCRAPWGGRGRARAVGGSARGGNVAARRPVGAAAAVQSWAAAAFGAHAAHNTPEREGRRRRGYFKLWAPRGGRRPRGAAACGAYIRRCGTRGLRVPRDRAILKRCRRAQWRGGWARHGGLGLGP